MKELIEEIDSEMEWLQTTNGDEVECISIENLLGILKKYNINKILINLG